MNKSSNPKWELIFSDSSTPAELKAEARAQLGLLPESCAYHAGLDSRVQSYWGRRIPEDEEIDPRAFAVYGALVDVLILGGSPAHLEDDAHILLNAFKNCRSDWMLTHSGRSLEAIRDFHLNEVSPETLAAIQEVLA
jgi:hypothetical protein